MMIFLRTMYMRSVCLCVCVVTDDYVLTACVSLLKHVVERETDTHAYIGWSCLN